MGFEIITGPTWFCSQSSVQSYSDYEKQVKLFHFRQLHCAPINSEKNS